MAEMTMEEAPRKARELFEKGMAAMERGNTDYAIDIFLNTLDLEPRLLKVRRFLRAAELKKAKEKGGGQMTHAIASLSGMGAMMKAKGAVKKNPVNALRAAEDLMKIDPLNLTFANVLVEAALAADMPEVAIQHLEILKEFYPKNVKLLNQLGKLYLDTNQPHAARDAYAAVEKLMPNDPKAVKNLKDASALASMKKGGWEEAKSYRDVMKDKDEAVRLEQQSKSSKSKKDVDDLIRETAAKVQAEPNNMNYRRALADLYTRSKNYNEALKVLREALEMMGGADPQIDLAISSVRQKQFDEEIEKLRAAGDEAGAAAREQARADFLLQDAEEKVKRYPNDLQFRYDLGALLYERGDLNGAIQQLQMAQRNPQRRIRALYYLAMCFKAKEQHDIAMEQLEKAASELHLMDDTKKDVVYEMGIISEAMGKPEQAVAYYKEIYAVDIGYKDIAQKIDQAYGK
ncbi:MAG TPA: tetratricopeptide repeat protein [Kiritimatiellia bacterium]|nr:tetratricopeptide repeat protein [Kiritimatiellia bacterium]HPA78419.1 tetratricopeptide repeat protein [Kiritimatiellia bacterium]HQQ04677.1 tetratricopeptide repeat protein [Kiritimatiellia bacterium]